MWKAGTDGVSAALAAGAPLVKDGRTLAEAKALETQMHLNAAQVHIFPADLEILFDSKGEVRMSHGMPVEYFRYTLVGDVDVRAKQDSVKPQGSQAMAPSVMGKHPNAENGEAYDRCTAMDDESHQIEIDAGRGGKENDRTWLALEPTAE